MNLIISGDNQGDLEKVELLAKELGLSVARDAGGGKGASDRDLLKLMKKKAETGFARLSRKITREAPQQGDGPSYGAE